MTEEVRDRAATQDENQGDSHLQVPDSAGAGGPVTQLTMGKAIKGFEGLDMAKAGCGPAV